MTWLLTILLGLVALVGLPVAREICSGLKSESGNVMNLFTGGAKRPLRFAGTWYESDPSKLARQIEGYIDEAKARLKAHEKELAGKHILAIIAPHAGYTFSGQTAACSYLAAKAMKPKRVFLLGPSHYRAFHGAALSADRSLATVFGDLKVDTECVAELKRSVIFQESTDAHRQEHSLELQLAFIKAVFGDVKVVPIMLGRLEDEAEARFIAAEIKSKLTEDDLLVVSSDFTHIGPRFDYQPFGSDWRTKLTKLDNEAFAFLKQNDLDGFFDFYRRTDDTICGVYAISVMLALLPDDAVGTLLDYHTSQESVMEDDDNSVSYGALVFSSPSHWSRETTDQTLSEDEGATLLKIARSTLDEYVKEGRTAEVNVKLSSRLKSPRGVFVTLYKKGELRGCIGYVLPIKSLARAVAENAVASASKDYRFETVEPSELKDIKIEVNVLTAPKRVPSYHDIRIGTDGIFMHCQGKQSVFLPSVASEYGWTLEKTLEQLSLKAGLPPDAWREDAYFEVFQSQAFEEH